MKTILNIAPGVQLCYRVDDFTDPWRRSETVFLVHGFGESGKAWFGWVPHLARRFRVIRIDQRGFGESSAMPADFPWSLDVLVSDLERAVTALADGPVHLVAAKIAGPVIMRFAATHPHLARSITVVGSMSKGPQEAERWLQEVMDEGVESWARNTMRARLGTDMPLPAVEWWVNLTSATPRSTFLFFRVVPSIDVTDHLSRIRCPALIIATDSPRKPIEHTKTWQSLIADSELVVLPGDAYHPAASAPDRCARETMKFLEKHSAQ